MLLLPLALAQDVVLRESLATTSTATDYYGGTFTGSGWRIDDPNSRQMWDLGAQVNRGSVSFTLDGVTFENLTGDNNHILELFDAGGHFSGAARAINIRVYGSDNPADHGDIKLKVWDEVGYNEARGGIQPWDGLPHTFTVNWDTETAVLVRDGVEIISLDVQGLDLSMGTLWLPLNDWKNGYSAPIGSVYSNLTLDAWLPESDTDIPTDDGDPTTFLPMEDVGVIAGGMGEEHDLPMQGDGGNATEASFLQYDLSSLSGYVSRATLRLHAHSDSSAAGSPGGVYAVADTGWSEDTLLWDARPTIGSLLAPLPATEPGATVEVDVTAGVVAGGRVAFALMSTGNDGAHFRSKEDGDGSGAAVLTVRLGDPPTGTDSGTPADDSGPPTDDSGGIVDLGDTATADDGGKEAHGACACGGTPRGPWLGFLLLIPVLRRYGRAGRAIA